MNVTLPVNMIPLAGRAAKSGGFVLAVLIGLALFAAAQRNQLTTSAQPQRYAP
jgi:hypothetical protein